MLKNNYIVSEGEFLSLNKRHKLIDVLRKDNELLFVVPRTGFKEYLSEYFSDCPELVEKIANKTYRYRDLDSIIWFYNYQCNQ
jgi:hypothetical protein